MLRKPEDTRDFSNKEAIRRSFVLSFKLPESSDKVGLFI